MQRKEGADTNEADCAKALGYQADEWEPPNIYAKVKATPRQLDLVGHFQDGNRIAHAVNRTIKQKLLQSEAKSHFILIAVIGLVKMLRSVTKFRFGEAASQR